MGAKVVSNLMYGGRLDTMDWIEVVDFGVNVPYMCLLHSNECSKISIH